MVSSLRRLRPVKPGETNSVQSSLTSNVFHLEWRRDPSATENSHGLIRFLTYLCFTLVQMFTCPGILLNGLQSTWPIFL